MDNKDAGLEVEKTNVTNGYIHDPRGAIWSASSDSCDFARKSNQNTHYERVSDSLITPWGDALNISALTISNLMEFILVLIDKGMAPTELIVGSKYNFNMSATREIINAYILRKMLVDGRLTWEAFADDIESRRVLTTAIDGNKQLVFLLEIRIDDDGSLIPSSYVKDVLVSLSTVLSWIPDAVNLRKVAV